MKSRRNRDVLILLLTSITLCSCSSGAPSCDDKDVIKTVKEIIAQHQAKKIIELLHSTKGVEKIIRDVWIEQQGPPDPYDKDLSWYQDWYQNKDIEMELIRPTSSDDTIRRASCAADVVFSKRSGNKSPITYVATKTKEGLIVEVSGLK